MAVIALSIEMSIIIPTTNEATCIEETLKSVVKQCPSFNFEIIVCDGGSKDRTVEIARKYARVVVSPTQDTGIQLDFATKLSEGKVLVLLDADTLLPEGYLQRVYESFRKDESLWACGAPFGYYGRKRCIIRLGNVSSTITEYVLVNLAMYMWYVYRDFFHFTEIPGCNFCIRRDIYFEVGGFKRFPSIAVDIALSSAVRELIRRRGTGKMKIFKSITVLTSPRHISLRRSAGLVKNYRKILAKARDNEHRV
jgi:cellulose synthase/poly-beta-1,6-N-acetylglucosamine synthase-like glycosyltransferase